MISFANKCGLLRVACVFTFANFAYSSAIIGGVDNGTTTSYAALVSPTGTVTVLSTGAVGNGNIGSVAINDTGAAIIGGGDNGNTTPFAALVSPSGTTTPFTTGAVGNGAISTVAINSSGAAIIGGSDHGFLTPFAALVSPSGTATPFATGAVGNGAISSVAINDTGAAIIGGRDNGSSTPFAALISPSGIATPLATGAVGNGTINSVAINDTSAAINDILNTIVPKSFGPGSSFANSCFALTSHILPNHLSTQKALWYQREARRAPEVGLLAYGSPAVRWKMPSTSSAREAIQWETPCGQDAEYSLWAAMFGDYAHQKKESNFAALTNWIGGAMVAFDYLGIRDVVIGGGAAYAFNYVHFSEGIGHAKTNQEFITLYISWIRENFFMEAALWGGLYQMKNQRHSVAPITSNANVGGWLLSPHLEISTPFLGKGNWFLIDPFAMIDWANNWQDPVHEKGVSGFNILLGSQYTSLLRTEVGIRFFETIQYEWGSFCLQEKGSWVNKLPFSTGAAQAFFVGAASSFAVDVFSSRTQNLGAVQLEARFVPCSNRYPYGSLNYQGEFERSFQLHLISVEIGKDF
jgi:hypothetical protein